MGSESNSDVDVTATAKNDNEQVLSKAGMAIVFASICRNVQQGRVASETSPVVKYVGLHVVT